MRALHFIAVLSFATALGLNAWAGCTDVIELMDKLTNLRNGQPIKMKTAYGSDVEGTVFEIKTASSGERIIGVRKADGSVEHYFLTDFAPGTYTPPLKTVTAGDTFKVRIKGKEVTGTYVETIVKDGKEYFVYKKFGIRREVLVSDINEASFTVTSSPYISVAGVKTSTTVEGFVKTDAKKLDKVDAKYRSELDKMGVKYQKLAGDNYQTSYDTWLMEADNVSQGTKVTLANRTAYYEVTAEGLPAAGKAELLGPALKHPDMAKYIDEMHASGYKLTIDSSLGVDETAGAYCWSYNKVIALKPDSTWQTFLHEFEHFKFNRDILKRFNFESTVANFDSLPPFVLEALKKDNPMAYKAFEMASKKGLPELAVNETFAVQAELDALKAAGYSRYGRTALMTRDYALYHQIKALKAIPKAARTAIQKETLRRAMAEKYLLTVPAKNLDAIVGGGIIGGGGIAFIAYNDKIGQFIIKLKNGKYKTVSVDDVSKNVSDDDLDRFEKLKDESPPGIK